MNPNYQTQDDTPPARRSQSENRKYRRQSLLKAAILTVAKHDIAGATVERICAQAGASRGLIAHYFDGKEKLLIAALTEWFDMTLSIKKTIALDDSLSTEEKIRAIAHSSYDKPSYTWENAAAWQAFTNASRYNKTYAKPIRNASKFTNRVTEHLFRQVAKERTIKVDSKRAAMGLYILDDGLWNSLATGKDNLTIKMAKEYCDAYIDAVSYTHLTLPTTSRV